MADLMNPGGGLTKSKLSLADATPSDVLSGKTFYSNGNKERQTGTIIDRGQYQYGSIGKGTDYIAINRLPEGLYRSNGQDLAPEARASITDMINYICSNFRAQVIQALGIKTINYNWFIANNQQGRPMSQVVADFSVSFTIGGTDVRISGSTPQQINTERSGTGSFTVT